MTIHPETYLDRLGTWIRGGVVLEIGCGSGLRSRRLLPFCRSLIAMDPSETAIHQASSIPTPPELTFEMGTALTLNYPDSSFDCTIFTLSLHHIAPAEMHLAIAEAKRVTRSTGYLIFIEPSFTGSLFEAELRFGAGDGDERAAKALAYASMLTDPGLVVVCPPELKTE